VIFIRGGSKGEGRELVTKPASDGHLSKSLGKIKEKVGGMKIKQEAPQPREKRKGGKKQVGLGIGEGQ